MKVRIAAEVADGRGRGRRPVRQPHPRPGGRPHVEVIAGDTHAQRSRSSSPRSATAKWTKAVTVEVPAGPTRFEVIVQVSFEGRVVQSAVLSGPVLDADAPAPAAGEGPPLERRRLHAPRHRPPDDPGRRLLHDRPRPDRRAGRPRLRPGPARSSATIWRKANKGVRQVLLERLPHAGPGHPGRGRPGPSPGWPSGAGSSIACSGARPTPSAGRRPLDPGVGASAPPTCRWSSSTPTPCRRTTEVPVCPTALAGADAVRRRLSRPRPGRRRLPVRVLGHQQGGRAARPTPTTAPGPGPGVERTITSWPWARPGVAAKADEVDTTASARIRGRGEGGGGRRPLPPVAVWDELKRWRSRLRPTVLVLITHTEEAAGDDPRGQAPARHRRPLSAHPCSAEADFLNPGRLEPGPVVIAIGCDTADLDTSFTDYVTNLHGAGPSWSSPPSPRCPASRWPTSSCASSPPSPATWPARHPPLRRGAHRRPPTDGGQGRRARPRPHRHPATATSPSREPDTHAHRRDCSPPATATPSSSPTARRTSPTGC